MMRLALVHRARKDMIDLLMRRGRLTDIHMVNFFNTQVEKEILQKGISVAEATATAAAAAAATSPSSAPDAAAAAEHTVAEPSATLEEKTTAFLSMDDEVKKLAQQEKSVVFDSFAARCRKVKELAATAGPLSWMADVYGSTEWSTSHLSHRTLRAKFTAAGSVRQVTLSGHATAAGGGLPAGQLPESVQVIVRAPPQPKKAGNDTDLPAAEVATQSALPKFLAVSVKLDQGAGKVQAKLVNGLLQLHFDGAVGEVQTDNVYTKGAKGEALQTVYRDPAQIAARQHVLTAAAYAGLLAKMEEVVALHVTTTGRYDGLLVRNGAVQMRLSQLSCFRYGVEVLSSFVIGDGELDDEDAAYARKRVLLDSFVGTERDTATTVEGAGSKGKEEEPKATAAAATDAEKPEEVRLNYLEIIRNERENLYQIPLLESVVLNIYAENALMDAMDCAWHVVRDYPLTEKVPHKSRADKLIDYPYLNSILDMPKYSVASADGAMELQSLEYLSPLLGRSAGTADGGSGPLGIVTSAMNTLQELAGLTSAGRLRLTAPHLNLRVAAQTVEEDLHSLLAFVEKERVRSSPVGGVTAGSAPLSATTVDPAFVFCVSNYLAEVFTNVAVLYRCTAALSEDEEGLGHREWLLAQCFTAASNARRHRYLSDYQLMRAAAKVVGAEENYATHPVELMNATPRKKEASGSGGGGDGSSGAEAGTTKKTASQTA